MIRPCGVVRTTSVRAVLGSYPAVAPVNLLPAERSEKHQPNEKADAQTQRDALEHRNILSVVETMQCRDNGGAGKIFRGKYSLIIVVN
jgi:hypothetical protein